MSRFWRHFISNGYAGFVERRVGLYGHGSRMGDVLDGRLPPGRTKALRVRAIRPDGPADHAGLVEGDLLMSIADKPVTSLARLHRLLRRLPVGLPLPVVLLRGRRWLERWVILNDRRNPAQRR